MSFKHIYYNSLTFIDWLHYCEKIKQLNHLETSELFIKFSKVFDSQDRGKIEQILQAYGLSKKGATAIKVIFKKHRRYG